MEITRSKESKERSARLLPRTLPEAALERAPEFFWSEAKLFHWSGPTGRCKRRNKEESRKRSLPMLMLYRFIFTGNLPLLRQRSLKRKLRYLPAKVRFLKQKIFMEAPF